MTLQQEAYKKIDQLSDEGIKALMDMIDTISFMSVYGFKKSAFDKNTENVSNEGRKEVMAEEQFPARPVVELPEEDANTKKLRADRKKEFMDSAGKIDIDEEAICEFRKRSLI